MLIHDESVENDKVLKQKYTSKHTIIQDHKRKFLPAANGYIRLSWELVEEEEVLDALKRATNSAILAKAGQCKATVTRSTPERGSTGKQTERQNADIIQNPFARALV